MSGLWSFFTAFLIIGFPFLCAFLILHGKFPSFRRHVHTYESRLSMSASCHFQLNVYCTTCKQKLHSKEFEFTQSVWADIGKRRGFYRAEETTKKQSKPTPKADNNSWWVILGLKENATKIQIQNARRKLAALYHPDKAGGNAELMAKINNAADIGLKYAKA